MPQNDGVKRYLDAAVALSQITRSRAEGVVRDVIRSGEAEGNRAQDWLEDLVRTSRQRSEAFIGTVRSEVRRQLSELGLTDMNDLAQRVAEILEIAEEAARRATGVGGGPARPPTTEAKKPAAKKSSAKRPAATKTKATATKAKSTTTKAKSTATKSTAKKSTVRKASAKTTAAKKTAATKKAPARTVARKANPTRAKAAVARKPAAKRASPAKKTQGSAAARRRS